MSAGIDPTSLALARSRLYGLLGRLLLDGWTAETLQAARTLPTVAEALPDLDLDRLAARHHRAFGLGVPPYVGVLAGEEAQMGGASAAAAREILAETGLAEPRRDVEPDHLGLLLRALGFCCSAEHDARRDAAGAALIRLRDLQRALLDEHLLPAWGPLVVAVDRLDLPEWRAVVGLAAEAMGEHRSRLGPAATPPAAEAPPDDPLDDPRTGLKRVARWLLVPANTGLWLTRTDLGALAEAADVPHGFGDRLNMLEALLFAAVDHGRIDAVLDALTDRLAEAERTYDRLEDRGLPVQAWRARLERARGVVRRLRERR